MGAWARLDHQSFYLLSVLHMYPEVIGILAEKNTKDKCFQIKLITIKRPVTPLHMSSKPSLNRMNLVLLVKES